MGTLRPFIRPENFTLPQEYIRVPFEESNRNHSYCIPLEYDNPNYIKHQIGIYFQLNKIITRPTETGLEEVNRLVPQLYKYSIYTPSNNNDENVIFCLGSDIDLLDSALILHSNNESFDTEEVDLQRLNEAIENGNVDLIGQSCVINQGTERVKRRKLDMVPYDSNDPILERGTGVFNEYLEILIPVNGINKTFCSEYHRFSHFIY